MSYVITRKNDKVFQMYCDNSDAPANWSFFCAGYSNDLQWHGSGEQGLGLPREFDTKSQAMWCLLTYFEKKAIRNQGGDLNGWKFDIREYLR